MTIETAAPPRYTFNPHRARHWRTKDAAKYHANLTLPFGLAWRALFRVSAEVWVIDTNLGYVADQGGE